ncbi:hypothetical protein FYZ48_23275 [Gimesia chilikensis]|uniref:hypothetical protein n=1 Tax=Gimesia chilikensis TaxID=2605989 RepID=UPI0011EE7732|nr:hypothetical protein [Gimesia chilikensis]KAA0133298.1 hypothetical protein FYZ48_23275 [Gimesia chilikensis]
MIFHEQNRVSLNEIQAEHSEQKGTAHAPSHSNNAPMNNEPNQTQRITSQPLHNDLLSPAALPGFIHSPWYSNFPRTSFEHFVSFVVDQLAVFPENQSPILLKRNSPP